ncbi:MAG: DNA polymerase III subunit alpha [Gemmatimonadetes bacterium]|nr:DNA polymerase III subunit alpha [Gemmatimonadota bacterium]
MLSVYFRVMYGSAPSQPDYVELHCHSGYSFLDGASHPEELVLAARESGYEALALTDHNGLYGSMEFAHMARAEGLQAITGAEVSVRLDSDKVPEGIDPLNDAFHMTLLAETPVGYANLCRLISEAHLESPRLYPNLPIDSLLERNEGLIVLTGCKRSPLLHHLEDSAASGEAFARKLQASVAPDRLFVELQDNEAQGDRRRNRLLCRLADRLGIPVVATGNVHYHRPARHRLQDVLVSIRNRATLDNAHNVRRPNALYHLPSPGEMEMRFEGRPDALRNTRLIAERCQSFDLTKDMGYEFPDFDGSERGTADAVLSEVCRAALDEKYPLRSKLREDALSRLERELRLVEHHNLSGFFLVYRDIMNLAREVGARVRGSAPRASSNLPPGRGRGSSVSSIICYLIGLSHIDPVENNLFIGRFLNEAMGSVPDIDLDFPRNIREELILEVYERYGHEHTGLVCTFPTYRVRSTVREVGKALDLPQGDLEKLAKLAERGGAGLRDELKRIPDFKEKAESPLWQMLADLAQDISGLPRHISQHVGGMIISSRPLVELVPLEQAAMEGRVLCQWDKDGCDDAGFIKIDFLALGMLSLVEEAVDSIALRHGDAPDLSRIDFDDEDVYDRICAGDTVGMFQVESRAQIQMLRRVRPRTLPDLAVQVAIVRPGPIVGGAVNPYVRRRELLRENPDFQIPYEHPLMEEALGETLGVIIFQDQVLKVCQALAGFSDGQAEGLRRSMSRKRSREAMQSYWEAFREGAAKNGVDETTAQTVFQQVIAFSEFGFPKSHAAAFGLLAYQSAWLCHYYPTEFYVALFNNQPMGFYSLDALARDARRHGLQTLLPHLNRSDVACTSEGEDLRLGLGFIRGWGTDIAEEVVAERSRRGPFRSLPDFLRRTPATLKRPAIENLIWGGGMDCLGLSRRSLLWQTGLWLGPESDEKRTVDRGDHDQIQLILDGHFDSPRFNGLADTDKMVAEYRMLRLSTEHHPLSLMKEHLPPGTVSSDCFHRLPSGATVQLAGLVTARQRPGTAKGYVFVLMEDEHGPINVIVKPDLYEKCRMDVRMEPFLWVRGRLQKDGLTMNVIAADIGPLKASRQVSRGELNPSLPPTLEYWAGPRQATPFRYLTALRQTPPGIKSFG